MKTLDQMRHERDMRVDQICDAVKAQLERETRFFKGFSDPAGAATAWATKARRIAIGTKRMTGPHRSTSGQTETTQRE